MNKIDKAYEPPINLILLQNVPTSKPTNMRPTNPEVAVLFTLPKNIFFFFLMSKIHTAFAAVSMQPNRNIRLLCNTSWHICFTSDYGY